ncbi:MAG TPA: hypothetical protein VNA88_18615 [Candidatus Kapabacteria bacterium]|nr:hypothetical protein [Candidatus Kapabacteria bacterium]
MPDLEFSPVDEVVRHCNGELVDIVVPDLEAGGVYVVSRARTLLVALDDLPELHRRGIFQGFVVDYLRTQLLL